MSSLSVEDPLTVGPGADLPGVRLLTREALVVGAQALAPLGQGLLQKDVNALGVHIG